MDLNSYKFFSSYNAEEFCFADLHYQLHQPMISHYFLIVSSYPYSYPLQNSMSHEQPSLLCLLFQYYMILFLWDAQQVVELHLFIRGLKSKVSPKVSPSAGYHAFRLF